MWNTRTRIELMTQVTGDLERTLTEVEEGATDASQKVIDAVNTLQSWFEEKVVSGLSVILTNMESKLGEVSEKAADSLKDVKAWFVRDAIQGIESLRRIRERGCQTPHDRPRSLAAYVGAYLRLFRQHSS